MRTVRICAAAAVLLSHLLALNALSAATWLTDFNAAKAQSAAQQRPILMYFTGSDWCPACKQTRAAILNQPEFTSYADSELVLMEIDLPRQKPMSAQQAQANRQLLAQYRINAFPTLLLVDQDGKVVGTPSRGGNARQFIASISQFTGKPPAGLASSAGGRSSPRPGNGKNRQPATAPEAPLFAGAPTQPPRVYTNLVLKSISGTSSRRFALINNETVTVGDTAYIKMREGRIKVRCLEVREKSVVIQVDGEPEPRELKVAGIRLAPGAQSGLATGR